MFCCAANVVVVVPVLGASLYPNRFRSVYHRRRYHIIVDLRAVNMNIKILVMC